MSPSHMMNSTGSACTHCTSRHQRTEGQLLTLGKCKLFCYNWNSAQWKTHTVSLSNFNCATYKLCTILYVLNTGSVPANKTKLYPYRCNGSLGRVCLFACSCVSAFTAGPELPFLTTNLAGLNGGKERDEATLGLSEAKERRAYSTPWRRNFHHHRRASLRDQEVKVCWFLLMVYINDERPLVSHPTVWTL